MHQILDNKKNMFPNLKVVCYIHVGSGSILSALRAGKRLIVVPNTSLMDNHQSELADELSRANYLVVAEPRDLARIIGEIQDQGMEPFPAFQSDRFKAIVDEEMRDFFSFV